MSALTDLVVIDSKNRRTIGMAVAAPVLWVFTYSLNQMFWNFAVFDVAGLDAESSLGGSVHFFLYDVTKILLLLVGITFAVAVLRSFVTIERTRQLLGGKREGVGNIAAAGAGVATPFCSCSAVPVFIGFLAAGVPLGVTMSFLIASPMVNEVAVILIFGLFGWKVAVAYVGFGLTLAILAGFIIGRMRLERWVEPFVYETTLRGKTVVPSRNMALSDRLTMGREEVKTIVGKIWPYLLVGIGIGAVIHGWAPEEFFARLAGSDNPLVVPLAVLIGIPLYSGAAGIVPLVGVLVGKGVAIGTVLAFMMAVVALSLPEMILLKKVLRPQLLTTFVAILAVGIMTAGYLFNAII